MKLHINDRIGILLQLVAASKCILQFATAASSGSHVVLQCTTVALADTCAKLQYTSIASSGSHVVLQYTTVALADSCAILQYTTIASAGSCVVPCPVY